MYYELYNIWKKELENIELCRLPSNFYSRVCDYLKYIDQQMRMIDLKTMKAKLLELETKNVKWMLRNTIEKRYHKLLVSVVEDEGLDNSLNVQEKKIYDNLLKALTLHKGFVETVLSGFVDSNSSEKQRKYALRFLKEVPSIIGSDMKTYGPFKVEDIASLPFDNAKILLRQKLVERIEFSDNEEKNI